MALNLAKGTVYLFGHRPTKHNAMFLFFSLVMPWFAWVCSRKILEEESFYADRETSFFGGSKNLQVGSWLPPATSTCQRAAPSGLPEGALGASLLARMREKK
ncbi:MAG: hypothetical protein HDR50_11225 [Desulfovibrio sp.]|uniref:hypothetical protein n=1 Tax=Desulfovibrio sp. TaxID=885 RepID=UPI001A7CB6D7|nr:hypothetical protein [Desulfovibrio sp.]MBD5418186.1 hypothetical protein [Desulfovibrio sp.]